MFKEFVCILPLLISRAVTYDSYTFAANNYNRPSRLSNNLYVNDLDNSLTYYGNHGNFSYVNLTIKTDSELFSDYAILGDIWLESKGYDNANIYPKYFVSTNAFNINYALNTSIDNNYLTFGYDLPSDFEKSDYYDVDNVYSNTDKTNSLFALIDNINFYIVNVDNETYRNGNFYLYYTFDNYEDYLHHSELIHLNVLTNTSKQTLYFNGSALNSNNIITDAVRDDQIESCTISLMLIYSVGDSGFDDSYLDQIYHDGYNAGYQDGYDVGYNAGNLDNFTFLSVLGAIADTPVLMLRNLFDFSIFGIQMYTVVFGLITALVVLWIIKKVI